MTEMTIKELLLGALLFTFVKCFTKNKKVTYKCLLFIDKERNHERKKGSNSVMFYAHSIRQESFI